MAVNHFEFFGDSIFDIRDATIKAGDGGKLLSGSSGYGADGTKIKGTIPENGTVFGTLSAFDDVFYIPAGNHSGNGTVAIANEERQKFTAQNIRENVPLMGVLGSLKDPASFPLACAAVQAYNVTLDTDSDEFPLQAFDTGGREIKIIGISAASVSLATTETTVQTRYIVSLLYSADRLLIATNATNFLGYCLRVGRTSTTAYAYGTSGAGSYFVIQDEDLLATGGATIKSMTPATAGYFKAGLNYHVFIGG